MRSSLPAIGASLAILAAAGSSAGDLTPAQVEARDIFRDLIAFRTSEGLGQVPRMAEYLSEKFREAGFAADDIHILPLGETASLVVRYLGTGKGGRPILLLAHMDVVTARPEDWRRDPFRLTEENGYFFGRGTVDVKQEVTALTAVFLRLKREKFVPSRDLIIALSGDEETEGLTARDIVTRHRELVDAEFALNGDGGGGVLAEQTGAPAVYYVQGAEKSYASFEFTAHNPGGHSSEPRADNAIYELADALEALRAYRFPVMWNDWTVGSLKATAAVTPGPLGQAMARFAANPRDEGAADVLAASPANVGRTRTTCVATVLAGGHAENALPQSASATVNCRIFPGTSVDDVRSTLQRLAGAQVVVRTLHEPFSADASPMRRDVMDAVAKAVHGLYPGVPVVPDQAPYATDGARFRAAGIPTYGVSGTFLKDSDNLRHGLDERLPVDAFYKGLDYWYALLKFIGGSS